MKFKLLRFILLFIAFILQLKLSSQNKIEILFYNVENLFDTEIDSINPNKEFSPTSEKKWDNFKYNQKINQIAKVIIASCESGPEFMGICEIENEKVLLDLVNHPLLKKHQYQIIHFESKDTRGIDVGFLYKKNSLNLLGFKKINVPLKKRPTRDILLITGIETNSKDTLAFFVNHWPSRFGGQAKSAPNRLCASNVLLKAIDSTQHKIPNCKIIAMGDFNDAPKDSSFKKLNKKLNNVFADSTFKNIGTLKYKRNWEVYDQFLISNSLFKNKKLHFKQAKIYQIDWLLEKDVKFGGLKPFRTYNGPDYKGGFSDHLPIVLVLEAK